MCPSTHSLKYSIMKPLIHTHINSLIQTHSPTCSHSLSLINSLSQSLTHSYIHSLRQSLTYSVRLIGINMCKVFSPYFGEMKAKTTKGSICVVINSASALTLSLHFYLGLVGQRKWQYGTRTLGYEQKVTTFL